MVTLKPSYRRFGRNASPVHTLPPALPVENQAASARAWNTIFGAPAPSPQGRRPGRFAPFRVS